MSYSRIKYIRGAILGPMTRMPNFRRIIADTEMNLSSCDRQISFMKKNLQKELASRKLFETKARRYNNHLGEELSLSKKDDVMAVISGNISRVEKHLETLDDMVRKIERRIVYMEFNANKIKNSKEDGGLYTTKSKNLLKQINENLQAMSQLSCAIENEKVISSKLSFDFMRLLKQLQEN